MYNINFACSVESSEIDLSEFQEENGDNGNAGDNGNDPIGNGDTQPTNRTAEPPSGNAGVILSLMLF